MNWAIAALFSLLSVLQTDCGQIETRRSIQLKPGKLDQANLYHFGTSLALKRFGSSNNLYVGTPSYNEASGNGIKPGGIFTCRVSTNGDDIYIDQTCNELKLFEKNGAMGLTMQLERSRNNLVVCGNQYNFPCSNSTIQQRMIGSCYNYTITDPKSETPLLTPCQSLCPREYPSADIVFALDESGSVGNNQFQLSLVWVKRILTLDTFRENINAGHIRVGVLTFNNDPIVHIGVERSGYSALTGEISSIVRRSGGTHIGAAINKAVEELDRAPRGVARQIIVLTDGESQDDTLAAANTARSKGITLLAVGVGNQLRSTLLEIAGSASRIFSVLNFDDLDTITDDLKQIITDTASVGLEGQSSNSSNLLTQCQEGMSSHMSKDDNLYVGAVGSYDRGGSIIDYYRARQSFPGMFTSYLKKENVTAIIGTNDFQDSYLGYSVTSGRFMGGAEDYVASGAPRHFSKGVVLIYHPLNLRHSFSLHPHNTSELWQLGGYFGHTVCSVDINSDTFDDLLVSAPLFSDTNGYDQGRVFVFMNDPSRPGPASWLAASHRPQVLSGSNAIGARFGKTIVIAGDIDQNGYDDIIVGAPLEGETGSESGAVYIYFVSDNGISETRKERILGKTVASGLKGFGQAILERKVDDNDFDDNGYPDVVTSAPSGDTVVVLLSRPIVDVTARITTEPGTIDILQCLNSSKKKCSTFRICITAHERMSNEPTYYDKDIAISLDSLVQIGSTKRLVFHNTTSSVINRQIKALTNEPFCFPYEVALNADAFTTSFNDFASFDVPLKVQLSYNFTKAHTDTVMSPILDPWKSRTAVGEWAIANGCAGSNGTCNHDLVAVANYSLPRSAEPYVIGRNPGLFTVNLTITNNGPDHSFFTLINITSGELALSKATEKCVVRATTESSPGNTVLLFKSSKLVGFMAPGQTCNILLEYPLSSLADTASTSEIIITGRMYSNAGTRVAFDPNERNNQFEFRRKVLYTAKLQTRSSSAPRNFIFNRTTSPNFATTLHDAVLGGRRSSIAHTYNIYNLGPHNVWKSQLTFTWPASILAPQKLPLLYLFDFQCTPASICRCEISGKVNPMKLPETNLTKASIPLTFPAPQDVHFQKLTTCNDVACDQITCSLSDFSASDSVTVTSSFKAWLPTLSEDKLSTGLSSSVQLNVSESSLVGSADLLFSTASTSISAYSPPPSKALQSNLNIGAIIGIIIAALTLSCLIVLGLWKAGFFKSKYAEKTNKAMAENDDATGGYDRVCEANPQDGT